MKDNGVALISELQSLEIDGLSLPLCPFTVLGGETGYQESPRGSCNQPNLRPLTWKVVKD